MKKISIMILLFVVALASCKKTPEVNLKYVDVERDLITVGTTTATVQCDYQYISTLKKAYLYYGEGEDETDMNTAEMRVVQNTLYVDLVGLKSNTTYSYFYEFHNGFNSMRTVSKGFKTEIASGQEGLPTVVTAIVSGITSSSAKSGGDVMNDGGADIIERGICWSINENPTLSNSHESAGSGIGSYTAVMSGLEANTTYHVRAYATNTIGTAYGLDKEFTTTEMIVPSGAISGLFSVSPTRKVYFSQGNLQYQASTNTWRFAENQYDFVGGVDGYDGSLQGNVYENGKKCDNALVSANYDGWIDLFCWGTSGWNSGNTYYHPWDISDYHGTTLFGPLGNYDLKDDYANADWGVYNAISNGGNHPEMWRTLTIEEWFYMLLSRITPSGILFAPACVNAVNGYILLPDNWDASYADLNNVNQSYISGGGYSSNIISALQWITFEQYGAIFLPAAGARCLYEGEEEVDLQSLNIIGDYWSTSYTDSSCAYILDFYDHIIIDNICQRSGGCSVRLVQDTNP